jgi:peptidoglycan/xylan/chitin deacetylase (PgdA/CDA1 family)
VRPFVLVRDAFLITLLVVIIVASGGYVSWWWVAALCIAFASILFLGAVFIRWNFFVTSLHNGNRAGKAIALSFDDGPGAHTHSILNTLKDEGVAAAFFSIGKHAAAAPDLVRRWEEEGHVVGNHSYDHSYHFDWKNREAMAKEIQQTNDTISALIGRRPLLFRPPYGVTNPALSQAISLTGMTSIGWSLRSFDTSATSGDKLLHRLLSQVKGGDVILLHDTMGITAGILTAFIHACREKGFTFVRLDHLLGIEAYA